MVPVKNTIDKFGRRRGSANESLVVRGPPGLGFNLTTDNHFDIQNKRLKNVGEPVDSRDCVTLSYLDFRFTTFFADIRKAMDNVTDLIIAAMKKYVNGQIIKFKKENIDNKIEEIKSVISLNTQQINSLVEKVSKLEELTY